MSIFILVLVLCAFICSLVFAFRNELSLATYLVLVAIFLDGFLPHLLGMAR